MIKMVVFDMAGTTVDEDNVVYKTLQKAINATGYTFTLEQVLEFGAGKEKLQAIKDILPLDGQIHSEEEAFRIFDNFKVLLKNAYEILDVKEQIGATDVFGQLKEKGIKVVLNTGYNRETAERLVQKIGWEEGVNFDALITASDVVLGRPNPDMIIKAMNTLGVENAQEVVKIGDSAIDIEEGKNADCGMTFGVTTGAQTATQLETAKPTHIVDSLQEMLKVVLA